MGYLNVKNALDMINHEKRIYRFTPTIDPNDITSSYVEGYQINTDIEFLSTDIEVPGDVRNCKVKQVRAEIDFDDPQFAEVVRTSDVVWGNSVRSEGWELPLDYSDFDDFPSRPIVSGAKYCDAIEITETGCVLTTYVYEEGAIFYPDDPEDLTFTFTMVTDDYLRLQGNYWELISTPRAPDDLGAASVFSEVTDLAIVNSNEGGFFIPGNPPINSIGDINVTQAYQVYCNSESDIFIPGDLLDPETEYSLIGIPGDTYWNWLGYPYHHEVPLETALSEILNDIVIVQTDDGRVYIPPSINTIGNMKSGEGYEIVVSNNVNFTYNDNGGVMRGLPDNKFTETADLEGAPYATGLPYAIVLSLTDEMYSNNPSIVEVYDGDLLVGRSLVPDENPSLVIAWEGSEEYNLPGFTEGNDLTLSVMNSEGIEIAAVVHENAGGNVQKATKGKMATPKFNQNAYANLILDAPDSGLPREFTVQNGYPNPFNATITVPFTIPELDWVSIEVYNLLGQKVFCEDKYVNAGYHHFMFHASNELTSGVYFVQFNYKNDINQQKIILLK